MSDLDNFFAKKDKKKNKGKKYNSTDEIARRLNSEKKEKVTKVESNTKIVIENGTKETSPTTNSEEIVSTDGNVVILPETDAEKPVQVAPAPPAVIEEEEEQWNEIEEKTVDVTNLKIARFSLAEEEEKAAAQAAQEAEEAKTCNGENKKDGVWKVEEAKSMQATICEAVDAGEDVKDVKAAVVAAAAASNSKWGQAQGKDMQPSPLPRGGGGGVTPVGVYVAGAAAALRRKKAAPDITNNMAFPSLGDAGQVPTGRKKRDENHHSDMSSVRYGMGARHGGGGAFSNRDTGGANVYKSPHLRTMNRYASLNDQT